MNTASCTDAGRPSSKIESMAARMVRPVKTTSSIKMISRSSMLKSIWVFFTAGCLFVLVQVVAEHGDIEDAQGDVDVFQFLDQLLDAAGHKDALGLDADQHKVFGFAVPFQYFHGQAQESAFHFFIVHDFGLDFFFHEFLLWRQRVL